MKQHERFPPVCISRGQGPWLYSDKEEAYLDCISSWWTNLFGHANARINQALIDQLGKIEHVMLAGLTHPNVVELSESLRDLTQGHLGHSFYADTLAEGFLHSHSYTGNPLACAAALASLQIFKDDEVLKENTHKARALKDAFSWVQDDERLVHFRQQGMILAFDLNAKTQALHPTFASEFFKNALSHQLLLRPIGSTVYVMPPYVLDEEQIKWMGAQTRKVLHATL